MQEQLGLEECSWPVHGATYSPCFCPSLLYYWFTILSIQELLNPVRSPSPLMQLRTDTLHRSLLSSLTLAHPHHLSSSSSHVRHTMLIQPFALSSRSMPFYPPPQVWRILYFQQPIISFSTTRPPWTLCFTTAKGQFSNIPTLLPKVQSVICSNYHSTIGQA